MGGGGGGGERENVHPHLSPWLWFFSSIFRMCDNKVKFILLNSAKKKTTLKNNNKKNQKGY